MKKPCGKSCLYNVCTDCLVHSLFRACWSKQTMTRVVEIFKSLQKSETFWAQPFKTKSPRGHFRFQGGSRNSTSETACPWAKAQTSSNNHLLIGQIVGRCYPSRGRSLTRLSLPKPGMAARPQPGLSMGGLATCVAIPRPFVMLATTQGKSCCAPPLATGPATQEGAAQCMLSGVVQHLCPC